MFLLLLLLGCPADQGPDGVASTVEPVPGDCPAHQTAGQCESICNDGIDNDRNGLIDCEEPNCFEAAGCFEADCGDGVDDDRDGLVDCRDMDCWDDLERGPCAPVVWVYERASVISRWAVYPGVPAGSSCPGSAIRSEVVWVAEPEGHVLLGPDATVLCDWTAYRSELTAEVGEADMRLRVRDPIFADPRCAPLQATLPGRGRVRVVGDAIEVDLEGRAVWSAGRRHSFWQSTSNTMPTYPSTAGYCSRALAGTYSPVRVE